MISLNCQFCNSPFEAERNTAKFCSDSCKTKANIKRRKEEKENVNNKDHLDEEKTEVYNGESSDKLINPSYSENAIFKEDTSIKLKEKSLKELKFERQLKQDSERFRLKIAGYGLLFGIGSMLIKAIERNSTSKQ